MTDTDRREMVPGPHAPGSARRRAALIATAIAVPVTVLLAFVFTSGASRTTPSNKPLGAVTIAAPPEPADATITACTKVFEKLPVQLGGLDPRKTNSNSGFVAAWGDPPVIIRCGIAKPPIFTDPQKPMLVDSGVPGGPSVLWQPNPGRSSTVYTSADRSVYVEVTVPPGQQPLPLLVAAVNALPATCTGTDAAGNSTAGLPICPNS